MTSLDFFKERLGARVVDSGSFPVLAADLQGDDDAAVAQAGPAPGLHESFHLLRPKPIGGDELARAVLAYYEPLGYRISLGAVANQDLAPECVTHNFVGLKNDGELAVTVGVFGHLKAAGDQCLASFTIIEEIL